MGDAINCSRGQYTIAHVDNLITDLKLIQKPCETMDRINIECKTIEKDTIWTKVLRTFYYTDESRFKTIKFIKDRINLAFIIANVYIPKYGLDHTLTAGSRDDNAILRLRLDNDYRDRLLRNIRNCLPGIESLKNKTYIGDDSAITKLEGIENTISIKLEASAAISLG